MASRGLLGQPPTQETWAQLKSKLSSLEGGNKTSLYRKGRGKWSELLVFVSLIPMKPSVRLFLSQPLDWMMDYCSDASHVKKHAPVLTTFGECWDKHLLLFLWKPNTGSSGTRFLKSGQGSPGNSKPEVSTKDHQGSWGNAHATRNLLSPGRSPRLGDHKKTQEQSVTTHC